ncbi:unnamed protein product, partial [Rotaria sp. Silwood1]
QVLCHGGLRFTSAFCFESAMRHLKKKAHGTKNLAKQIADWINIKIVIETHPRKLSVPIGINKIGIDHLDFKKYRQSFRDVSSSFHQHENDIILFLRFKVVFTTYN